MTDPKFLGRRGVAGRTAISSLAMAVALVVATPAFADNDYATLHGHVDGVGAGAVVTIIDTDTGHKTTAQVDANGDYTALGLRPSSYRVEVPGRPAKEATLAIGQTVIIDFVNADANTIVVRGARPRLEIVTQEISTGVTQSEIENLPQNARNFLSFASLAPGIQLSNPSGAQQIQAGALSPDETNVFIDGVSFKNLTNHGGQFGQNFGQGGNPFPQSAVQEYQIETQNFGAETGQAGSAVINAITKTGGNSFHGGAYIDFQPGFFVPNAIHCCDANGNLTQSGNKGPYNRKQFGGEFGGPIIKDKLTFYLSAEATAEDLPSNVGKLNPTNPASYGYPGNIASAIQGVVHPFNFHQGLYFGKLTFYASPQDTVNLSTFIRRETNLADIDQQAEITHARNIQTQVSQYQLNWKHSSGSFLNILNLAYNSSHQSTPSVGTGPEYNLTNPNNGVFNPSFANDAELGAHFFEQADFQKSYTIKDDATLRRGNHKIKFGGQLVFNSLQRSVSNAYNGRYFYYNPGASVSNFDPTTATPYGAIINTQQSDALSGKDTQFGLYLQDEWKPNNHWTFNYGLRWDMETNANNNNYVTPAYIVTALKNYVPWQAAGINYLDYVSTGNNRHIEMGEFQPRLGFSYDVKGDRSLVIFGGAGRYFDRSLFIEGVNESLTNSSNIANITFQSAACPSCTPFTPSLLNPNNLRALAGTQNMGGVWLLKNDTPAPFSDQFDLGVRKTFDNGIQTTVSFSYVRSHNLFSFVRGNRLPDGTYSPAGGTFIEDNFPACGQLGWNGLGFANGVCNGALATSTFQGKLDIGQSDGSAALLALYVQVKKPFTEHTRWGFTSSLTIQRARTNDSTPSIFNNDENFNGSSQTVYGWGNVAGVPKWIWNTSADFRAGYGFILSGSLNLNSGPSFGNIIFSQTPNGTPIPAGACCYANFNGVYFPKPFIAYKRLDLKVTKEFELPFAHGQKLSAYFEAFNVFNWVNRNYNAWGAGSGLNPPLVSNGDGAASNDQRQFQAGLRYKF